MTVIGGFRGTRNYKRRKALGRYQSPYQWGGTLFTPLDSLLLGTQPKPWEFPWKIPYGRIKGTRQRRRRIKR